METHPDPDEVFAILDFETPPKQPERKYDTIHFAQTNDKDFGFLTMNENPRYAEGSRLYIFTPNQSEKLDSLVKNLDEILGGDTSELKNLLFSGGIKKVETEIPVDRGGSMHKFEHCLLIKHDNGALRRIIEIMRDKKLVDFPPDIENWFPITVDINK